VTEHAAVIRNDSMVIYRFEDGRIRERWCRERSSTRAAAGGGRVTMTVDCVSSSTIRTR
jgi:hypothetical protein